MSEDWLLAVTLGSFAMGGVGLLFFVIWAIDRNRISALYFAGAIAAYTAGTVALTVPMTAALGSSIHGVLFPLAMVVLADGLLRRVGDRLPLRLVLAYVGIMAGVVWYFAYASPLLIGRIITQNVGTALLLAFVARRLWMRVPRSGTDRAVLVAAAGFAASLGISAAVAPFSKVPRELLTRADVDSYMQSNLELCLIVVSTVMLPGCMVTLLAATLIDMVQELRFQCDCDELTGVFNRRGFNRRAEAKLRSAESCVMVLADLDFFKTVNDALGHAGGDEVLIAFARVLTESPAHGRIVGRIGGEEFAVLLPDFGVDLAIEWVESARTDMASRAVELGGGVTTVTASFGITTGDPQSELTALLDEADKALYKAKLGGRNQVVVST